MAPPPLITLFGYSSSPFTHKIRLALQLKRLPFTYIPVPSTLPRPLLRQAFALPYRKIPILALNRDLYCDTSLITSALEHFFPSSPSLYPPSPSFPDSTSSPLHRTFASFWIDRPFFRATTGLIPARVWRSSFGVDRAQLIGHPLDPDKLERKFPENLGRLDTQLSLLEGLFGEERRRREGDGWLMGTETPGLADAALFAQLHWGVEIASGRGVGNLTGGEAPDEGKGDEGVGEVFNEERYPGVFGWYGRMKGYVAGLEDLEERGEEVEEVLERMRRTPMLDAREGLLPTPAEAVEGLGRRTGLVAGALVSVAPDDTGRDDPTIGTLLALSPEEVVLRPLPLDGSPPTVETQIHFPRIGFVVRPVKGSKL